MTLKELVGVPGGRTDRPARDALAGRCNADVAVVGGGLAGLAAAYYCKRQRPDAEIVVIEADRVGSGATGRSTGMVGPNVGGNIVALRRRYGDDVARRMFQASLDAVTSVLRLVGDDGLQCDLQPRSQLVVAQTPSQADGLRAQATAFSDLGFELPLLDRAALAEVMPGSPYLGALRFDHAAVLDPHLLCGALAGRLTAMGVRIHEKSRVTAVLPGDPVRLDIGGGEVRSRRVLLATDGSTDRLGVLGRCVIPVEAHAVRTAPVPPAVLDELRWPGRHAIIETRNFFNYYRVTTDNRVVFGGARPTSPGRGPRGGIGHERAWRRVEAELRSCIPALAAHPVADRWYGRIGCTLDRLPIVGPLSGWTGVWFSGAWSGHGLALSVASAEVVAGLMDGPTTDAGANLPWFRSTAPRLPGGRAVRSLGVQGYLMALDAADRVALRFGTRRSAPPESEEADR